METDKTNNEPITSNSFVPAEQILPSKKPNKPLIAVIAIIALLVICSVLLLAGSRPHSLSQQNKATTTNTSENISEDEKNSQVQYIKREKIFETVKIPVDINTKEIVNDFDYDQYEFFKIGTIKSGKYKDGELILALIPRFSTCKALACEKPIRFRYIKKKNIITFLPKISVPLKYMRENDSLTKTNPFEKFNLTMNIDNEFTLQELEYPEKIVNSSRQKLQLPEHNMEEDGELDENKLYKAFTASGIGGVYTTKPEFSPSKSFEGEKSEWDFTNSIEACKGSACFGTNAFFVFRPDGTFLKYTYTPDFSIKEVSLNDTSSITGDYLFNTIADCSNFGVDQMSVISPSTVRESDMITVGKNSLGDAIYELKDKENKIYTEFYDNYKIYYKGQHVPEDSKIKPFTEFITSKPVLLWYDPFGRLVRFNNQEFLPPHFCEPIIYLYPESTQQVNVKLSDSINVTDASPQYLNGWDVIAQPTGELVSLTNNRKYPYLFWEGWSYVFPLQKKGFVVKKSEVRDFFDTILPKLGLNAKEKSDFMKSWLPHFSDSPYYFITFIDKATIDSLAPIEITPQPDTTIRILMDYKPLDHYIDVEQLPLLEPPLRKGFTMVEWGGIKR